MDDINLTSEWLDALDAIDSLIRHHIDQGDVRRFRIDNSALSADDRARLESRIKTRDTFKGRRRGALFDKANWI